MPCKQLLSEGLIRPWAETVDMTAF